MKPFTLLGILAILSAYNLAKAQATNSVNQQQAATVLLSNMVNATVCEADEVLFKLKDVSVACRVEDVAKKFVAEDEVKTKVELELRRNNVPIDPKSSHVLALTIHGLNPPDGFPNLFCYSIIIGLHESQYIFREGECRKAELIIWQRAFVGYSDAKDANENIRKDLVRLTEVFSNGYLSTNPKKDK